jgi:hypothetical protein
MTPERAIAMLTVKISRFEMGSGGTPEVSWEDVCHAKAGLSGGPLHLFDHKYFGEPQAGRKLWASLMLEQLDRRIMCADGMASGLCKAAILEYTDSHLCPYCNGTGLRLDQSDCDKCDAGRIRPSLSSIAIVAGLDLSGFMRVRDRYNHIFNILNDWDSQALGHICGRLTE